MERGRRLHTIAGAVVLFAFLVEHLLTNASVLGGAAYWDRVVGGIERWKLLAVFEVVFILLPLAYHAGYGLVLLRRPRTEADVARYGSAQIYTVQRVSAVVVLAFVLGHFWELRAQRLFFGLETDALYTVLVAHLSWTWAGIPWIAILYVAGIAATCFHLANGLFAASALKGWATARMRVLTGLIGFFLFLLGFLTVLGFATGLQLLHPDLGPGGETVPCGVPPTSTVPIGSSRP